MPASFDDLLTATKNAVQGINSIEQALAQHNASVTSLTVTTSTLIVVGRGKLLGVCVVVAGSAAGAVYNLSAPSGSPPAAYKLCSVPNSVGFMEPKQVFSEGLLVVPGTGQSLNVTYVLI